MLFRITASCYTKLLCISPQPRRKCSVVSVEVLEKKNSSQKRNGSYVSVPGRYRKSVKYRKNAFWTSSVASVLVYLFVGGGIVMYYLPRH